MQLIYGSLSIAVEPNRSVETTTQTPIQESLPPIPKLSQPPPVSTSGHVIEIKVDAGF